MCPSMVSAEWIPLRILLPCGIVRADLAILLERCGRSTLVQKGRTGGFPP